MLCPVCCVLLLICYMYRAEYNQVSDLFWEAIRVLSSDLDGSIAALWYWRKPDSHTKW